MPPTLGNGKICYLEIPTVDARRSAAFYAGVCGWRLRERRDGSFRDPAGNVIGLYQERATGT
jgi:predicted enzyme related to lactoylglutathione lyase